MNMYQFVEQALGNKKKTKRTPIGGGLQAMYDGQRHFKVWRYITKYSDSPPNNIEINMIINAIRSSHPTPRPRLRRSSWPPHRQPHRPRRSAHFAPHGHGQN